MPGNTVFDDGVRLTRLVQLRVPPDLRTRMEAAATAEGLTLTEFARRAIAERVARQEGHPTPEPPAPQPRSTPDPAAAPAPEATPSPAAPLAERPARSKRTTAWNT